MSVYAARTAARIAARNVGHKSMQDMNMAGKRCEYFKRIKQAVIITFFSLKFSEIQDILKKYLAITRGDKPHQCVITACVKGIGPFKIAIFHYCIYCKFVSVILFVAISRSFTEIERVVFELCANVRE